MRLATLVKQGVSDMMTDYPDTLSFDGGLMDLPEEMLANVVDLLCGGPGVHDITLWRYACILAQTCSTFSRNVLQSKHCVKAAFIGELVGPDVEDGRDKWKESTLSITRDPWFYKPLIMAEFRYGAGMWQGLEEDGNRELYVHSIIVQVPLLLEDVMRVFYKPPGWEAAGKLALTGKDAPPWRECFPTDKYPEAPERIRVCGDFQAKYQVRLAKPRLVDAGPLAHMMNCPVPGKCCFYNESSHALQVPASAHVTATCSTGIEEFRTKQRAHYLDDLELGLCGLFTPEFLRPFTLPEQFFNLPGLDPEEPPDLYYRFKPDEARRIAGYPSDRAELYKMIHPPKPKKLKLRKLQHASAVHMDLAAEEEEEWDPDERARKKEATRKRIKQSSDELAAPEDKEIDDDSFLPAFRKSKRHGGIVIDFDLAGYETMDEFEPRLLSGWKKMGRLQSDGTLNDVRFVSPCKRISTYKFTTLEKEGMIRPAHLVGVKRFSELSDSEDDSFVVSDGHESYEDSDSGSAYKSGPRNEGAGPSSSKHRLIEDSDDEDHEDRVKEILASLATKSDFEDSDDEEEDDRVNEVLASIEANEWGVERASRSAKKYVGE